MLIFKMKTLKSIHIILILYFVSSINAQENTLMDSVDQAIQKATLWLVSDKDHLRPETYILYDLLERKFNAPPVCNKKEYFEYIQKDSVRFKKIYPFLRLAYPDIPFRNDIFRQIRNEMDLITLQPIWSDQIEIDTNTLFRTYREHLERGGYLMTHVFLNALFFREQNHEICRSPEFLQLEMTAEKKLRTYIVENPYPGDITIEAYCFLTFDDKINIKDYVSFIRKIVQIQLENGAWYYDQFRTVEEQHTVILALWLLYEFRYPDALNMKWIQH